MRVRLIQSLHKIYLFLTNDHCNLTNLQTRKHTHIYSACVKNGLNFSPGMHNTEPEQQHKKRILRKANEPLRTSVILIWPNEILHLRLKWFVAFPPEFMCYSNKISVSFMGPRCLSGWWWLFTFRKSRNMNLNLKIQIHLRAILEQLPWD